MRIEDELDWNNDLLENKNGWLAWYKNGPNKKLIRAHGSMWVEMQLNLSGPNDCLVWRRQKDPVLVSDLIDNLNGIINGL